MMHGAKSAPKPRCLTCDRPLSYRARVRGEWEGFPSLGGPRAEHVIACKGLKLREIRAAVRWLRAGKVGS